MAYNTIVVSLNDIAAHRELAENAGALAATFDAHLTGLLVVPAVEIYASGLDIPITVETRHDYFRNAAGSVKEIFGQLGGRNDFRLFEAPSPDITEHVIHQARAADLLVLEQHDSSGQSMLDSDFVERILVESGRPAVVLPRSGTRRVVPEVAVIGWNGRREAARATFDSIPLLRHAKEVFVVWVDPKNDHASAAPLAGMEITEVLARHGIKAIVEPITTGGEEAGEALLEKVMDHDADMLVMGAYGHARFAEFILGGATRTVLGKMKCPTFFSH